jgi:hypothetical protein
MKPRACSRFAVRSAIRWRKFATCDRFDAQLEKLRHNFRGPQGRGYRGKERT